MYLEHVWLGGVGGISNRKDDFLLWALSAPTISMEYLWTHAEAIKQQKKGDEMALEKAQEAGLEAINHY